jgi:hypothetical protein
MIPPFLRLYSLPISTNLSFKEQDMKKTTILAVVALVLSVVLGVGALADGGTGGGGWPPIPSTN